MGNIKLLMGKQVGILTHIETEGSGKKKSYDVIGYLVGSYNRDMGITLAEQGKPYDAYLMVDNKLVLDEDGKYAEEE